MNTGYRSFALKIDGQRLERTAHSLVAELFIGERPAGTYVCHGNGVKLDNRVSNLRYDTPAANAQDAIGHGTFHRGSRTGGSKLKEAQVAEIMGHLREGLIEQRELARAFGVKPSTITDIKKGRTWAWLNQSQLESAAA